VVGEEVLGPVTVGIGVTLIVEVVVAPGIVGFGKGTILSVGFVQTF
jgi:hypothetical protein